MIVSVGIMLGFLIQTSVFNITLSGMIFGLGWGIIWGCKTQMVIDCVSHQFAGVASATLWTIQNMIGCFDLAICGSLFNHHYRYHFIDSLHRYPLLLSMLTRQYRAC